MAVLLQKISHSDDVLIDIRSKRENKLIALYNLTIVNALGIIKNKTFTEFINLGYC